MEDFIGPDSIYTTPDTSPLDFSGDMGTPIPDPINQVQAPAPSSRPAKDPLLSAISDADQALRQKQTNDLFTVTSYDPEVKERYRVDPSIYNDYFDPHSDNESVAYANWDKWDAVSSGLGAFKDNFANAFSESAYSWVRAGKALFNMDVDYLSPSMEELDEMSYDQRRSQIENPIFHAPGEEDDILTKGFLAEALGNLGFTFGTISEVITEQLLTKGVEALLASSGVGLGAAASLEATTDAQSAMKLGRLWKQLGSLFTGRALGKSEVLVNAAKGSDDLSIDYIAQFANDVPTLARNLNAQNNVVVNGVRYGKGFLDNALTVASKVPFIGEAADAARIARAGKGILNTEEVIRLGAGGLRRSFGEWQMAAGEAAIEAGGNYKNLMDKMVDDYTSTNGSGPIGEELQQMKQLALKSSMVDFGTNAAILGVMNKITFGNMMGKFATDSKKIAAIKDMITGTAAKSGVYTVAKGVGTKPISYQLGTMGVLGILPKIATDFGKKQAAWELGKSSLRGVTRIEVAEGIQENLQEGTNEGLVDYYYSIYKGDLADWGDSFREAVDSQMTKQGAKTFLMGALTGIFSRPGMMAIEKVQQSKFLNPSYAAHRQSVAESIEAINKFYDTESFDKAMKESVKQIKLQGLFSNGMVEAITLNDKYQYYNNRDSSLIQAIMHAKRTGTVDTLATMVAGYGSNFTEAQFKEAFGYTPQELGKQSTSEVMGEISDSIKKYSDVYDKYSTKFNLVLSAGEFLKDPDARKKFEVRKAALLDAIQTVAFIESKSQSVLKRSADIVSRLSKYSTIGQSLSSSFQTLVSPDKVDDAILLLEQEIKSLEQSATPETPLDRRTINLIESKREELELLRNTKEILYMEIPGLPRTIDPLGLGKTAFRKDLSMIMARYFTVKNKQNNIDLAVTNEDVEEAIDDIYDYIVLGKDHQDYTDAVNMLNDPESFGLYHEKLMDARVSAYARMFYDEFMKLGEISSVARKWVDENQEILKKLIGFANRPSGTYQNLSELERIRQLINQKVIEFRTGAQAASPAQQAQQAAGITEEEKRAIIEKNREVKPAQTLYQDPSTRAEADEYMASRYDFQEIEDTFPFTSQDPNERVVKRYYFDEKGERKPYGLITIGVTYEIGGEVLVVDNMENLIYLLRIIEETQYNKQQESKAQAQASEAEAAAHTEALDNEKTLLVNYVDKAVIFNGQPGILKKEGDDYYVEYPDGSKSVLGKDTETKALSLNDIVELSFAPENMTPAEQEVLGHTESSRVDVNQEGAVVIELDENLEHAYINGVKWKLVKNADGLVESLETIKLKKKGKGVKRILLRMGAGNPKTIEYAARINSFLTLLKKPISDNKDDLLDEIEVLTNAESIIDELLLKETDQGRRSDILMTQYQVNKILSLEANPKILDIKTRYDNGESLTEEEMMDLAIWAESMYDQIKKNFTLYITNPVLNSHLQILQKQYINPISDKLFKKNERRKPRSKKATAASPTKKRRSKDEAKATRRRKGEPSVAVPDTGVKPKKGKKKDLVDSVGQLELDFAEKTTKKKKTTAKAVADEVQDIPIVEAKKVIKKITQKELKSISTAIAQAEEKPVDTNPFAPLTNKKSCEI